MKKYFIRTPLTGWFLQSPRWFYNLWPWAGVVELQKKEANYCDFPCNDDDIDGVYRYLCWHVNEAGLSSNVFHYLEVLKQEAEKKIDGNHPQFENFIRAFWRRIEPYKNDFGKELPEKMPVQFKASMETAILQIYKKLGIATDTTQIPTTK